MGKDIECKKKDLSEIKTNKNTQKNGEFNAF